MRDQKAALSPFIMAASKATRACLCALLIAYSSMPHVLSAKRARRLTCACRYCCCVMHTATRRCWRLPYSVVDELEPFEAAAASRRGTGSTWSATSGCTADGGLQLMAVFEHCQRELTANARSQHVGMDVVCAADTRRTLRDSVRSRR